MLKDKLIPNIPFLPGSYSSKKLERERKGMKSPFRPEQAEGFALLQTLGFKIEKADLKKLKTGKVFELKRKIDGFKEQINLVRKEFRNGVINRETAKKEIDIIADKIRKIAAIYGVAFKLADRAKEEPALFDRKKK